MPMTFSIGGSVGSFSATTNQPVHQKHCFDCRPVLLNGALRCILCIRLLEVKMTVYICRRLFRCEAVVIVFVDNR